VRRRHHERFDVVEAARLEVEWWRVHRVAALYSHVYGVKRESVLVAARERADAMDLSDEWVEQGCNMRSPLVAQERAALVRSFAALLAAVHR
jgi:hypothetical protein